MVRDAAGVLTETESTGESTVARAERVVAAMAELQKAGFTLVPLPPGATVKVRKPRWWRKEKEEWTT